MTSLPPPPIPQAITYAIYPPIGLARVENSREPSLNDGWFYAPEVPGRFDEPLGGYKDQHGRIKRQAARFRIYALENGVPIKEVTAGEYDIEWSVQLANKKPSWYNFLGRYEGQFKPGYTTLRNSDVQAENLPDNRDRLVIRTNVAPIGGPDQGPVELKGAFKGTASLILKPPKTYKAETVYPGEARTDKKGHLIILGGRGDLCNILDPVKPLIADDFNTPGWIDDTSDGRITARVRVRGDATDSGKEATEARVLRFTQEKRAQTKKEGKKYDVGDVEWYKHIWPILQRPALLSWVNIQATGGHGPSGPGNFFDEYWLKALKNNPKDPEHAHTRKEVLERMRLPWTNPKYDNARFGQVYPYFMPWLSGDGGRTVAGDPTTFASITELQYDRLVKWTEGDFTVGESPPPPPQDVDEIELEDRPAALTRAALEPTIGAPLYPGLEASWNMEQKDTYDHQRPFSINEKINPGDLTRYLSLPWQSDFYRCRNYWWPAVRPDSVLPEEEYQKERGLRPNYTDDFPNQPFFANTDMDKNWHLLGIITQRDGKSYVTETEQPIFIETKHSPLIDIAPDSERPDLPQELLHVPLNYHRGIAQASGNSGAMSKPLQSSLAIRGITTPHSFMIRRRGRGDATPRFGLLPIQTAIENLAEIPEIPLLSSLEP
ncbi:hypothetical protein AX16_010828 [Volvariella volvacea WC 439]|nr:hypothetical protein AX16_010828 [Volvariella volvacea WC 439]